MKIDGKIRLHKLIWNIVREKDLDYTNPEIQRNIENYGVNVDGSLIKNRLEWIYPDQQIELPNWPLRSHGDFSQIQILYEDDLLLVIFKPSGIVVQPGAGHKSQNLVSWLNNNYNLHQIFDSSDYQSSGLINRIDKETQGVLLIGKTIAAKEFYQNQFRERKVQKKYLAIVDGVVEFNYQTIHYQTRDKRNPAKQKLFWSKTEALNYNEESREAITKINPIYNCLELNQTIVEVEIKTGRMHQIRLVCEALGFPLSNDSKYNKIIDFKTTDRVKANPSNHSNIDKEKFEKLKKELFGDNDFSLLSNFISIKKQNGETLTLNYKEI